MIYRLENEYRTQRDNAIAPSVTCQVTSAIMALAATGVAFDFPKGSQPEDYLATILDSPSAHEKLLREYPDLSFRPPREVHAILSWGINELVGKRVTTFTTRATLQEIFFRVAKFRAASMVSGRFTPQGHVVALVGFESEEADLAEVDSPAGVSLDAVSRVIIDDPWGDYPSRYRSRDGDDVSIPLAQFDAITREYGAPNKKWAHLFSRDGVF